jgi:DNA topoisomerase VI subunit B
MALRTFHSNPALGGFGGESSTLEWTSLASKLGTTQSHCGDAFAQIIKELVDNAVDACLDKSKAKKHAKKRVRVVIERYGTAEQVGTLEDDSSECGTLRVTVSDNGCGMKDVQSCVDPFHTNKAHASSGNNGPAEMVATSKTQQQTAGRYGIGLTRK